jgi:hypothetical protein
MEAAAGTGNPHAVVLMLAVPPTLLTQPIDCHIIATNQLLCDGGSDGVPDRIGRHLALLAEVGLGTDEPGERRRVRSAPMRVARQFPAALAPGWDGPLDALKDHLDQRARGSAPAEHIEEGS